MVRLAPPHIHLQIRREASCFLAFSEGVEVGCGWFIFVCLGQAGCLFIYFVKGG